VWLKKLESGNLSQIAQIIINLEYFQGACSDFELLLTESRQVFFFFFFFGEDGFHKSRGQS